MGIRLDKPWEELTAETAGALSGQLGVYEVADADGAVVKIGMAGGREPFGLRSALLAELDMWGPGHRFRVEVTHGYMTRHQELLMVHVADHGTVPPANADDAHRLGRLTPS